MNHPRTYEGQRIDGRCSVTVTTPDTLPTPLPRRHELFNHSPDGFEWGYHGSGPAQLALAIMRDHLDHEDAVRVCSLHRDATGETMPSSVRAIPGCLDRLAVRLHQSFKRDVVAAFDRDLGFKLTTAEVSSWLARQHLSAREVANG